MAKSPIRVLFIDDEADSIAFESRAELLETFGLEVTLAPEIDRAAELLRQKPPDCVILDLYMPAGSYYSLAENRSADPTGILFLRDLRLEYPNLPVLIVSAASSHEMGRELHGPTSFLEKPAASWEIADALRQLLNCRVEQNDEDR